MKNHVGVQVADDDSTITFYTSSGDPMNSPAGCTPSDLYGGDVVTCTMPTAVRVELGAGDDDAYAMDGIPVPVTLSGGPGADWLTAGEEPGVLDGGAGEDKLVGAEGDDVLRGGDGNDTIEGADGRDRIEAGAGDDLLAPDGYEHANADVVDGGPASTGSRATTPAASATPTRPWRSPSAAAPTTGARARATISAASRRSGSASAARSPGPRARTSSASARSARRPR